MENKIIRVAIDGPAAAGKSTVAKLVAEQQKFIYVDTGAMYRAITLKLIEENVDLENENSIEKVLNQTKVSFDTKFNEQIVLLDGVDVSERIRMGDVTALVSKIAQYESVRKKLTEQQREMAKEHSVVMDGRDIGAAVIPDAEIKIFLIASVEERAERRHKENVKRGFPSDLQQIIQEIAMRDEQDYTRKISPLTKAEDAIELDTTSRSINEVVNKINELINQIV